jgi:hypothetical protein
MPTTTDINSPRMTARIVGQVDGIACDQRVRAVFTPAAQAGVLPRSGKARAPVRSVRDFPNEPMRTHLRLW